MNPSRLKGKGLSLADPDRTAPAEGASRLRGDLLKLVGDAAMHEEPEVPARYVQRDSGKVFTLEAIVPKSDGDSLVRLVDADGTTMNLRSSLFEARLAEENGAWSPYVPPEADR